MSPIVVLRAPLSLDLTPLTQQLWSERIAHRVVIDGDMQCLILADPTHAHTVANWVTEWRQGTLAPPEKESISVKVTLLLERLIRAPLTFGIILLILGSYIWMQVTPSWLQWLSLGTEYWPQQRNDPSVYIDMGLWGLWRPTLLHFSVLHLINNTFWVMILGRAIELRDGRLPIILLLLGCGLSGNMLQWWYAGPAYGGISGVVFGLLAWVGWRQLTHKEQYRIPRALLGVMIFMMLLTIIGDAVIPGLTGMAHGGHVGGLVFGLLLALIWPSKLFIKQ